MIETILVLETAVDDMSPQTAGYVMDQALALGALDAYFTPCHMKKNRPGFLITILARPEDRATLMQLLLRETPTLGVRVTVADREVLPRQSVPVETRYGTILVKAAKVAPGEYKLMPEHEDCRAAALRHGVPLQEIWLEAHRGWRKLPSGDKRTSKREGKKGSRKSLRSPGA